MIGTSTGTRQSSYTTWCQKSKIIRWAAADHTLHWCSRLTCTRYIHYGIMFVRMQDFVPWCERSTVLERRDDSYIEAELEVGFKVFVER